MSDNDSRQPYTEFDENSFYFDSANLISDTSTISESFFEMENGLIECESETSDGIENGQNADESFIGNKVQIQVVQNDGRPLSRSVSQPVKIPPKYFISQQELQHNTCEPQLFIFYIHAF